MTRTPRTRKQARAHLWVVLVVAVSSGMNLANALRNDSRYWALFFFVALLSCVGMLCWDLGDSRAKGAALRR